MLTLRVKKKFHAAHSLPGLGGKCARLHGHTWTVILTFEVGTPDPETGITVDFHDLDTCVDKVIGYFDHYNLNDRMPPGRPPSAENLAIRIAEGVTAQVRSAFGAGVLVLLSVAVWETDSNCAVYTLKEGLGT